MLLFIFILHNHPRQGTGLPLIVHLLPDPDGLDGLDGLELDGLEGLDPKPKRLVDCNSEVPLVEPEFPPTSAPRQRLYINS